MNNVNLSSLLLSPQCCALMIDVALLASMIIYNTRPKEEQLLTLFVWLISQQYFSLRINQSPVISQQYFYLRTNQHQSSATSQTKREERETKHRFWDTLWLLEG
jgi:hypothetical protein